MKKPPGLNARYVRRIMKLMSRVNTWLYRISNGKIGGRFLHGAPVALLTTIGRKSGLERTTPLLYLRDDDSVVVVASQGGRDKHPLWYLNLMEDPHVTVQIEGDILQLRAREADEQERERLWPMLTDMYPDFSSYRSWTDRKIPIIILEPHNSSST